MSDENGFTILEVLSAALISSMVLGVLWMTLGSTNNALQRVRSGFISTSGFLAAYNRIEADLSSAMLPSLDGQGLFHGDNSGMRFSARIIEGMSQGVSYGVIKAVQYEWRPDYYGEATGDLIRSVGDSFLNDNQQQVTERTQVVLNAKSVAFEYWDQQGQRWVNNWDNPNVLPTLVKLSIKKKPIGSENTEMDLVFPVYSGRRVTGHPSA